MKLRCWPGAIAMYVGMVEEARGRVCCVVRPMRWYDRLRKQNRIQMPAWKVSPPLSTRERDGLFCSDVALRPFDAPATDTTTTDTPADALEGA
jgi:hypothetical protein